MFLTTVLMIILAVIFGAAALLKGKPIFLSGVESGIIAQSLFGRWF